MEALARQQCVASTSGRCSSWLWRPQGHSKRRQAHRPALGDFDLWQLAEVPSHWKPPSVVPGARTLATPRLSNERVFQRLVEARHLVAAKHFGAFYSSVLGGIVMEPGLMVLHIDDHMVHRGHGVYDVVALCGGTLYQLDEHVARLAAAAEAAGLQLPMPVDDIKRVLLDTAAASLKLNGHVKFWITPGRGGMGVSPSECTEPALYALCTAEYAWTDDLGRTDGLRAAVSPVEPPPAYFAALKSASYLQNVLVQLEAEGRGYDVGLFVDEDGEVLSGPDASLAMVTKDDVFVYAPFERAPPGITVSTLAQLIPENLDEEDLPIKAVEQRPITLDDLANAQEAFVINTTLGVMPLTHLEEQPINDGGAGYLAMALQAVLVNDREPREGSDRHTPVPYGALTGMRSQLT